MPCPANANGEGDRQGPVGDADDVEAVGQFFDAVLDAAAPEHSPGPLGPVGPLGLNPSRSSMKLAEQAARHRWPMAPAYREGVVADLLRVVLATNEDGAPPHKTRERISASRALAQFDRLNVDAELARLSGGERPGVAIGVTIQQVVQEVGKDPDYVEYCRARAIAAAQGMAVPAPMIAPGSNGNGNGNGNGKG